MMLSSISRILSVLLAARLEMQVLAKMHVDAKQMDCLSFKHRHNYVDKLCNSIIVYHLKPTLCF